MLLLLSNIYESIHLKKSQVLPVTMSHFVLLTGSSINVYVYIWINILIYKEREKTTI